MNENIFKKCKNIIKNKNMLNLTNGLKKEKRKS